MKKLHILLFVCIVVTAAILRLYKLNAVPNSLYWEEAALGYDAYSILQTGKDYHGNPFPIVAFPSFGDFKPSLYFYSIVPFTKLVGVNEWSVRLPSALAGIGTVILIYFIAAELYGVSVGLFASAFFGIQPWSVQLSRVGFETNLATFLVTLGVLFLLKARKHKSFFVAAAVALALSMYAYHSERIVAPLLAFVIVLSFGHFKHMKWVLMSGLVALVILMPIIMNLQNPAVVHRAQETSIFLEIAPIEKSNQLKDEDNNNLLGRILHHRYIVFADTILSQYGKNFSLSFLFLDGDENIRHGTKEFGVLYHWEAPFILIAIYELVRRRKKWSAIPLYWILIAAIPVAMTLVSPHTLRFASAAPAFAILSGLGVYSAYNMLRPRLRKVVGTAVCMVILLEGAAYLHVYFKHYPALSAPEWQYGYKQLVATLSQLKQDGQKVYITREQGRPSIYYLFYNKIDPRMVQAQDNDVKKDQQELLQVGEYYFVDELRPERGSLVASSPAKRDPTSKELSNISLPDGKVVWSIWEKE